MKDGPYGSMIQSYQLDEAGFVLAGGMENMTQVPHIIRGLRSGLKLGQGKMEDWLWEGLKDPYAGCAMGDTAENCGAKYGITRQQAYTLTSTDDINDRWQSVLRVGLSKEYVENRAYDSYFSSLQRSGRVEPCCWVLGVPLEYQPVVPVVVPDVDEFLRAEAKPISESVDRWHDLLRPEHGGLIDCDRYALVGLQAGNQFGVAGFPRLPL